MFELPRLFVMQVNAAGVIANGSIETTSLHQYDDVMNSNVRFVFIIGI